MNIGCAISYHLKNLTCLGQCYFWGEIFTTWQKNQKMMKKHKRLWFNMKFLWFLVIFLGHFSEIKGIKLITFSPRHFLCSHLQQHFCKNVIAHLGLLPFNVDWCWGFSIGDLLEEFDPKKKEEPYVTKRNDTQRKYCPPKKINLKIKWKMWKWN